MSSSCAAPSNPFQNGYNASGSVSVSGFQAPDSFPDTWTWTRYVVNNDTGNGFSTLSQTLGLQTSPLENLLDPSYPYNGCIVVPLHVVTSNPNANKDDGTCSSVLSSDCLAELKSQLDSVIDSTTSYSGCGDILGNVGTSPTSKCYSAWSASGYSASRLIPLNTTTDEQCNLNPGDSDASNPAFLSWHYDDYSNTPNNLTNYDHAILFPQPVFVVAYTNSSGSTISSIMCIPANNTTPGSRTVEEADGTSTGSGAMGSTIPKKSSGGRVEGSGVKLAAVIGMIGLLFLID